MRIGVLIPEFPGQTHIFFWRELEEFRKLGLTPEVVSTRRPPSNIVCHVWSAAAMSETLYLAPPSMLLLLRGALRVLASGPKAWGQAGTAMRRAEGVRSRDLPRMVSFAVLGAALAAEARRRGWSHVHAHSAADSALLATFCWFFGGPPYSLTLHGDIGTYGRAQNVKWENARFGITVNHALREQVLSRAPAVNSACLRVAPMGVDVQKFQRSSHYEPPRGHVRLVTCGRLHHGKAHGDLIRAVALLHGRGVSASLIIIGEGPDRACLESLRTSLGVADHVDLAGALPEHEVRQRLEDAHFFVLASRNEALGVATMEAMAMELPVIVTDVGGVSEMVRDGIDGLLVPPADPSGIATAVERLLQNPEMSTRLSAAGRTRIMDRFTSAEIARTLAELLGVHAPAPQPEDAACAS